MVKPPDILGIVTHLENLQKRAAKIISGILRVLNEEILDKDQDRSYNGRIENQTV